MTPKQKVQRRYPGATATNNHDISWWLIFRKPESVCAIGLGSTPQKAWADAARRMKSVR